MHSNVIYNIVFLGGGRILFCVFYATLYFFGFILTQYCKWQGLRITQDNIDLPGWYIK